MSGPYDPPGVRCGRPGSLRIPRIQDKMTRFRAKPASKAPKSRRRGRPNPFALPLTPPENRPSAVPATHLRRPHHSRRTPTPTPILQLHNPTPQRRYGPPLLQGDRHAPESVIGLSEPVIGIVGIRNASRRACLPTSLPIQSIGQLQTMLVCWLLLQADTRHLACTLCPLDIQAQPRQP